MIIVMETIRTIGVSICVTAAVTAIFSMLAPDSKFDKVLKFAISLFFLTGLISPFVSGGLDFHVVMELGETQVAQQELSESVQSQFGALAEKKLAASLEKMLAAEGISVRKVTVTIHIDDVGSVSISRLEIILAEGQSESGAAAAIRRETGITPEVAVESGKPG